MHTRIDPTQAEEILEEVEIELYVKSGEIPPRARRYIIRVDKEKFTVSQPSMTGREILTLASKIPVERYRLDQKLRGGKTEKIELDEVVDFTKPGVERFMTLAKDLIDG